ncbi:uncharacterized protein LOC107486870 [Arachis duranensis]|uniref:Uncharacterized protein LOC107486870 n=1 Tax=Arachis duranensis TaxID=130453 RepID=A0A6P4D5X1_ARADU|nr:uncharacterized protein LOC107486870 [Arachis duranensis]
MARWWWKAALVVAMGAALRSYALSHGWDKDAALNLLTHWSQSLGVWAIPLYVSVHTLSIALLCVFSAKILGASLSFWIGRLIFRSSKSAVEWAHRNRYFNLLSKGVEQDGWRFVLLARFSPLPSYVINYTLAATDVGFLLDFLLPTAIGCIPMILQNTSIGSLAGAAVASASGSKKSQFWSYFFPLVGILSSVLISLRIKKYSTQLSVSQNTPSKDNPVEAHSKSS